MPEPNDLIRNLRFPDHHKDNIVRAKAFKFDRDDEGHGISVHRCGGRIASEAALTDFQVASCVHDEGVLGICRVNEDDAQPLGLNVVPEQTHYHRYGDLHCLLADELQSNKCPGEVARKSLALIATRNGSLRPMRRWDELKDDEFQLFGLTKEDALARLQRFREKQAAIASAREQAAQATDALNES